MNKWILVFILDGFGIGAAKDASLFGDEGADTCRHLLHCQPAAHFPTLTTLGLFDPAKRLVLEPQNPNKDTLSGLHELLGDIVPKWTTFSSNGIPDELLRRFENLIHTTVINGGKGSGTEIIQRLGPDHLATGSPIVYTSADSVFQIASHEEKYPLSTLYYWACVARMLCNQNPILGRVIARPFLGQPAPGFYRTPFRKDFPFSGGKIPLLEALEKHQISMMGNRIICDLFPDTPMIPILGKNNTDTLEQVLTILQTRKQKDNPSRILFVDLEDFDMVYGHRRDPAGYANAMMTFDTYLHQCIAFLEPQDLCLLTADHGNDPTFTAHTDHTRENVPLVSYPPHSLPPGTYPMSLVAQTIMRHFFC